MFGPPSPTVRFQVAEDGIGFEYVKGSRASLTIQVELLRRRNVGNVVESALSKRVYDNLSSSTLFPSSTVVLRRNYGTNKCSKL